MLPPLLLVVLRRHALPLAALAGVALIAVAVLNYQTAAAVREQARLRAEIVARDSLAQRALRRVEAWQVRSDSLSRELARTTTTTERTLTRWRTRVETDTLPLTDTVWVKETLALGDSLTEACTLTIRTCTATVASRDSVIEALRERERLLVGQVDALGRLQRPSRAQHIWLNLLLWSHFIVDSRRWASGEAWPPKPILVDQTLHLVSLALLGRILTP